MPPASSKRPQGGKHATGKTAKGKTAKRSRLRTLIRSALLLIGVAAIGLVGYAAYLYYLVDEAFHQSSAGAVDAAAARSVGSEPVAVLLLGTDTRPESPSLNTDVIMVAALNPATRSATVVSVPRDTLVQVKGYSQEKANAYYAAFRHNNKKEAVQKTKALFGSYLGIPIDYMVRVDFSGFERIVDSFGGLTVDVDMAMCYTDTYDGTSIRLKEGRQRLDGRQTLDFVRYRKGNCERAKDSNDIERNERQQQVVSRLLDTMRSPQGLLRLGSAIRAGGQSVETDMPPDQIKSLIWTYMGIQRDKINYIHLEGQWRSPYIRIDAKELKQATAALIGQLQPAPH